MTILTNIDRLAHSLTAVNSIVQDFDSKKAVSDFDALFVDATEKVEEALGSIQPEVAEEILASAKAKANGQLSFAELKSQNFLASSQLEAIQNRPNLKDFMEATGVSASDASELLYGVMGSNADLRDWARIMASGNPIDAARAATAQMYNSEREYELVNHHEYGSLAFNAVLNEKSLSSKVVLRRSGNFAEIQPSENIKETFLVSSSGLLLRGTGTTQEQLNKAAWLFGFELPDWLEAVT